MHNVDKCSLKGYIPVITLLSCRIMASGTEEMKGFPAGSPALIHWISFHTSGMKHYEILPGKYSILKGFQ